MARFFKRDSLSRKSILLLYVILLTVVLVLRDPWAFLSNDVKTMIGDPSLSHTSFMLHFTAYFILGILVAWAITRRDLSQMMVLAILHGGLTEYFQSFIPGRWPNQFDFYANTLGVTTIWFTVHLSCYTKILPLFQLWKKGLDESAEPNIDHHTSPIPSISTGIG